MKTKTSISLSESLLKALDRRAGAAKSRSELVETAVREWLTRLEREERDARDAEIINRHAERLNREAEDVLRYQGPL